MTLVSPAEKIGMPLMGLGTYQLRASRCVEAVCQALELGYRHIDTAEMYSNEAEIGEAISTSGVAREKLFITTKVWPHNFHAKEFLSSAEDSLRRLKLDYVDLLLLHWPRDEVPLGEPLEALASLIESGKVRHGGISNFSVAQMAKAKRIAPGAVRVNQVKCHFGYVPFDVVAAATSTGIAITAYSPLAHGAVRKEKQLIQLGQKYGVTPSQIALRWLTQQGIAVIPKASTKERLIENLASRDITLHDDDIERLGRIGCSEAA